LRLPAAGRVGRGKVTFLIGTQTEQLKGEGGMRFLKRKNKCKNSTMSPGSDKKIRANRGRVSKITLRLRRGQIWTVLPKTK
jgi:hypothetical protein